MAAEPIDAVITWVDGDDPAHAARRNRYQVRSDQPGASRARFASSNEIVHAALSILRFAPFFRRVFIVTDSQQPPVFEAARRLFPDRAGKLEVVDHREIFRGYEEYLPSFSSPAISMTLHRIPGIAARFVYFNDDFFLLREVEPSDFFDGERPVLRGGWLRPRHRARLWLKSLSRRMRAGPATRPLFSGIPLQRNAAREVGSGRVFVAGHTPYPMRRATMERFEREHPARFRYNLGFRFRDPRQFPAEAVANHLEILDGNAVLPRPGAPGEEIYIDVARNSPARIERRLVRAESESRRRFLCVQGLEFDADGGLKRQRVQAWLDQWILGPNGTDR